jgi:acyl-coenzyme A synthetase/AMP-(fatty) acid ligase
LPAAGALQGAEEHRVRPLPKTATGKVLKGVLRQPAKALTLLI